MHLRVPDRVTEEELRTYFFFSLVRDPIERFYSGYAEASFWVLGRAPSLPPLEGRHASAAASPRRAQALQRE